MTSMITPLDVRSVPVSASCPEHDSEQQLSTTTGGSSSMSFTPSTHGHSGDGDFETAREHLNDLYFDAASHPTYHEWYPAAMKQDNELEQNRPYCEDDQYSDDWEDDSPYPEVRCSVSNMDDPTMPTNTFRMWFIGILTTVFISAMNQFFSLRYPSVQITALVAQLIALPFGKNLERLLPCRKFTTFGHRWSFNPGPWNIKEHTLVVVMANVVAGGAYATDIIATQRTFYDQNWSMAYQLSLVVSTQLIGFAFAGASRRFLVWPAAMIWPQTLVLSSLQNVLHSRYMDDGDVVLEADDEPKPRKEARSRTRVLSYIIRTFTFLHGSTPSESSGMSEPADKSTTPGKLVNTADAGSPVTRPVRTRRNANRRYPFFIITLILSTLWTFFPSYIFTGLSTFTPLCWVFSTPKGLGTAMNDVQPTPSVDLGLGLSRANPAVVTSVPRRNIVINMLFGYTHGLGLGFLTFDWAMIAYNGSPLVTPWWAEVNVFVTLVIVFWVIAPIMYLKNTFYSHYLPMSSSGSYDNSGLPFDSRRVVVDGVFRPDLYKDYSPLYIPITFALSYGLSFGALSATVTHTYLWYRHDIKRLFGSSLHSTADKDIHARLMLAYKEVPHYWYASIGIFAFVLGAITCEVWDTKLPIWAYVLSICISLFFLVPIGILQSATNLQVGLNVISELIVGYVLPGKPIAMMIFKTFGYITMTQALSFVSDLKLGHYMKIPPRMMFLSQTIATIIASFVAVGVQAWMFANIPGLCEIDQPNKFTCPGVRVFGNASLVFGAIGPARAFNWGSLYHPTVYFFLIGAILPIPFYFLARRYPHSIFKYVNIPICFTGMGNMPPASGINYSSWALVGFVFQYCVRRYRFPWWSRFNYLLSAGLDSGVALGTVLVFFSLVYPKDGKIKLDWWGNNVVENTPDYLGTPLKSLSAGERFGLDEWS